jgi:hypothetical protein
MSQNDPCFCAEEEAMGYYKRQLRPSLEHLTVELTRTKGAKAIRHRLE